MLNVDASMQYRSSNVGVSFDNAFHTMEAKFKGKHNSFRMATPNNFPTNSIASVCNLDEEESSTLESVGLGLGNHWSRLALFGSFSFGTGKNNGKHVLINSEA